MRSDRVPPTPLPALSVYLIHAFVAAFAFTLYATLSGVFRIQIVGLDPLQLILVGTVLEATVLLAELPTGVVADAVSRRWSLIVGTVLIGAGFLVEGALATLTAVLVAQVIWGLGAAFESGAVEAWLSDEIGEKRANDAFLRAAQVQSVAVLLAIPVAGLLGRGSLATPLVAGGIVFLLLAVFLFLAMREGGFAPEGGGERNPFRAIPGTLRRAVELGARRPLVWTILGVAVFAGASSETFDRLWEARLIEGPGLPTGLDPATWFAILAAATAVLGIAATEVARRGLERSDAGGADRRPLVALLLGITIAQAGAVMAFGLAGRLDLAVAMYLLTRGMRTVHTPLLRAWLNRELEPATRATAFSAAGFADALGQVAVGPLLGLVAVTFGMPVAFVIAGLLLGPAAWWIGRAWRMERGAAA